MFEIDLKKVYNLASQVIIKCFFASLCVIPTFALIFLSAIISHMQRWYEMLQTQNWFIALIFLSAIISHMQRWYEMLQTQNWFIASL